MRLRADVSVADTDYGQVLLDERSGRYWQLNPTGVAVVRALLEGADENAAVAALTSAYEVDEARARQDVSALVAGLRTAGLVTT
ncbi:coenzyme PQQ synthesis protein D (PqqD) [Lentzea atacamensis]|uniref:Coenzyme PQQ synthesis protein D (PqqD) n=1 Tax=Lentzea atacamensis TaxID=531938 RepID=A0A316I3R8_9PSEU|nr:lasso peptide biosynthesis PqqD family chaperone [Lentzea atacamensis]PWK87835.1 coenzyme PQQ synthesis protein D (PqqD) [Lentzea atacamensis]RAS71441.1 coenzyme PQQ synthesis protein D (PqqD) [Lentzea atacamensis]